MVSEAKLNEPFIDYLQKAENKSFMRLLTCGSVDDGKSTLIGRLLYDTQLIFDDQISAIESASKQFGTTGDDLDLALLVDGLEAEREQGITIDVAYRFFATEKRKFIIADTPGHIQYTRNMVTGASTADLAILMIDARKGLLEQTRRHAYIVSLLGIKHVVVAVNKMDLVENSQDIFETIQRDFTKFAENLKINTIQIIPISARFGDNVATSSEQMPWYGGPILLDYLNDINIQMDQENLPFRMPVQWVNRPNLDFRGFCGQVASGTASIGQAVVIAPSGQKAVIKDIVSSNQTIDGQADIQSANTNDAITILLDQEIDISRGDVITGAQNRPTVSDQFAARIIWMAEKPLYAGRSYLIKMNNKTVSANITEIKHRTDIQTFQKLQAKEIQMNEIATCNISCAEPLIFDPYEDNRAMGAFIIIDRMTNETVGAGMVKYSLYRASNIHIEKMDIDKNARSQIKHQKPAVLWFTGLSGSGKSTIANLVEHKLHDRNKHTYILDGDNVRHGLNVDLGFTDADRIENIRRIGEVAKLMVDAGVITLVSFISPFRSERHQARALMEEGEFIEIFIDTPLEECQKRDVKGLYDKAIKGEIKNFTGISSPYEAPKNPELSLNTLEKTADELADDVINYLEQKGFL